MNLSATQGWSVLDRLAGRRLPGGCADCDAYQTVTRHPDDTHGLPTYLLTVHHDDTCPTYRGLIQ